MRDGFQLDSARIPHGKSAESARKTCGALVRACGGRGHRRVTGAGRVGSGRSAYTYLAVQENLSALRDAVCNVIALGADARGEAA